jgi:uncharacterized membrane protein
MLRTLFSLISLISITSPALAAKERTVCTATINSSDEKEIFQKNFEKIWSEYEKLLNFANAFDNERKLENKKEFIERI